MKTLEDLEDLKSSNYSENLQKSLCMMEKAVNTVDVDQHCIKAGMILRESFHGFHKTSGNHSIKAVQKPQIKG